MEKELIDLKKVSKKLKKLCEDEEYRHSQMDISMLEIEIISLREQLAVAVSTCEDYAKKIKELTKETKQ